MAERPAPEHEPLRASLGLTQPATAAEHTDLFAFNLYPYASVYLSDDGMLGGDARDRIAGFWRAVGLTPPPEPDHLVALLGLWATLEERERAEPDPQRRALRAHATQTLLWEHLASWLFAYLTKAEEVAPPFYVEWALLLRDAVAGALVERNELPAHFATMPPFDASAAQDADALLTTLLAPARCGTIVTRADLLRAGETLGLAVRQGERRYALRGLFGQDADATLRWLRVEAQRWASVHAKSGAPATIRAYWHDRAERTAAQLAAVSYSSSGGL